jgi:hypothetical protein
MNNKKNIILEEYENEFSYKKSKTNLDIQFNRIAFIFFYFFGDFSNLFNTIASFRLVKRRKYQGILNYK